MNDTLYTVYMTTNIFAHLRATLRQGFQIHRHKRRVRFDIIVMFNSKVMGFVRKQSQRSPVSLDTGGVLAHIKMIPKFSRLIDGGERGDLTEMILELTCQL